MNQIMPLLVLVAPCYNEADLLPHSLPAVLQAAQLAGAAHGMEVRLIAVNDGSGDNSRDVLDGLVQQHPSLHVLHFTRNFGKEAALLAGLELALQWSATVAVVTLDADLQHPPELLAPMLAAHAQGYPVVEAVKDSRGPESRTRSWLARPFYRLFERLSGLQLDRQTDYKLLDVRVVRQLVAMPERGRFYRGQIAWLGHPSVQIPFDVPPRPQGNSQWSAWSLVRYAWGNLLTFSTAPLKLLGWMGMAGLAIGLLLGLKAAWDHLSGQASVGFTTVIGLQIIFGSLLLLALGLIGQYLGRIYEELKRRPAYVLQSPAGAGMNDDR